MASFGKNAVRAADSPAITLPATIEAFEQADLYAKTAGYVSDVKADIGDHVKDGDLLAVIDVPELGNDLEEAKATLNAKKQFLAAAGAATKQAAMALEVARHQLERYRADNQFQQITLKRQQELFEGKAVTDQQLDEFRNKAAIATADVGVAEAKVAAAEADVAGAHANRDVAAAQVQVAAAQVQKTETLLRYTKITAPFAGVVTRRMVNRGDLVQSAVTSRTNPLFTVQRIDVVRIFCEVPQAQAALVPTGTPAAVKVVGTGGEAIPAKITRNAGALNPDTRTLRIEIDLPNPGEKLLPGTYAQVTFTLQAAAATSAAP